MSQQGPIELLKVKVFLYKYAPYFSQLPGQTQSGILSQIDRYNIQLDETKYFTKLDISDFVSNYSFNQTISSNTFEWQMSLYDTPIPFSQLNKQVKVFGPDLSSSTVAFGNLAILSQAEVESGHIDEAVIIANAKAKRGNTPAALVSKVNSQLVNQAGIRLSDLMQKYDLVSVFLYKDITPLDQLLVNVGPDPISGLQVASFGPTGRNLIGADLQTESVLLSPGPNNPAQPFFANEFNGFLMHKSVNRSVGAVDMVNISGNGITRLFGSTRRILKSSVMQESIYSLGEVVNPSAVTANQNIYVGQTIEQIFADLFQIVYRVTFQTAQFSQTTPSTDPNTAPATTVVTLPTGPNFYDISALKVGNNFQTNLFTVPPFLLAEVMKLRGFSYREPSSTENLDQLITLAQQETSPHVIGTTTLNGVPQEVSANPNIDSSGLLDQNAIAGVLNAQSGLQTYKSLTDSVLFDSGLNILRPYFVMIEEALRYFNPELRTPFEIIDEIKSKTYLEFFEQPNGQVVVRSPDYNNVTTTVFSSAYGVVDTNYNEVADNFCSRHKVGYGVDVIGQVDALQEFAFTDGKLLLQYGFLESGTDINPNVKDDKTNDARLAQTKTAGLFKYAEYFLRLANSALKTGSVRMDLDPNVKVGMTFFDEANNKFSYIVGVSKTVSPGTNNAVTMTLQLGFVRDAYLLDPTQKSANVEIGGSPNLQFQTIPRLVDIASVFAGN